jgi:methylglutaconyl-CoA hydratase
VTTVSLRRSAVSNELSIERNTDVLLVRWDRGDGNVFTGGMIQEFVAALEDAARDPALRFVRLSPVGPNFCMGREREARAAGEIREEASRIVRANEALKSSPLVSVAELRGAAAGYGAGLVAGVDVAIASDDATISFPEILGGLAPTVVISWLAFAVPYKRAFEVVATGRRLPAKEALKWGLLTEMVPRERVTSRADEVIAELRQRHAMGLRDIKSFFSQVRRLDPVSAAHASVDALVIAALNSKQ